MPEEEQLQHPATHQHLQNYQLQRPDQSYLKERIKS